MPSRCENGLRPELTTLGCDIGALIREYDALARFQDMVSLWHAEWRKLRDAGLEFERKRNEHARRVEGDERLRDENAGRPGEGWEWELIHRPMDAAGQSPVPHQVAAWIPPDLLRCHYDDHEAPLPLPLPKAQARRFSPPGAGRELTLPEKYAVLAAICDATSRGTAKINPWKGSANYRDGVTFGCLVDEVERIPETDEPHLRAILDEVACDLTITRRPDVTGDKVRETAKPETPYPGEPSIPPRAQKAGEQYRQAAEALGVAEPTDREAYEQFAAALQASGEKDELPSCDTWQRNLRTFRKLAEQQKNKRRAGRERSAPVLVRADQIDAADLPTNVRPKGADE